MIAYTSDTFADFQASLSSDNKDNNNNYDHDHTAHTTTLLGKLNIPQEGTANFEIIIPWLLRNVRSKHFSFLFCVYISIYIYIYIYVCMYV